MGHIRMVVMLCLVVVLVCEVCAKKKRFKGGLNMLQSRETSAATFVRLFVMRLIYGFAKMMGLGEQLGDVLNGAFVPPGEEDDYGDYGDGGDDDYF